MPKDEKEKLVPNLRFKGFTDDWIHLQLGDILSINSGRDYKHLNQGDIPVYGTGGYMTSVDEQLSDETAIGLGRKGTINKPQLLNPPFWTVDTLFYLIPFEKYDLTFIYYLFQNINWMKYDESTGVPSLSKKTIGKIKVLLPSFEEQVTTGKLLKSIDNIITLEQEKVKKITILQKGLYQALFLRTKELLPEMYFSDYDNNWEKTTLDQILTERNKQIIPSEDYPLVSFTVENGVTAKTDRYNREFLVRTNNKKYKKTKIDDIVYNPANLKFGAIAKNRFGNAVLSPIYVTYKINKGFYPDFIELLVTSSEFIQRALRYQEGTVYERMAVKSKDFLTIEVKVPSYDEQVKIASLFMKLNTTLDYLASEIEYYNNIKTKLLNNLFV